MCGICGFNYEDKLLLRKMCDSIKHRGPDDEGYFTDTDVSIGMRRLSIIDLNTGHQPQHNENNDVWIIFNGEIFNFMELRTLLESRGHNFYTRSDTEVIIHAYEEWGEECAKNFRGQFSFCIYDSKKKLLFLARDQLGLIPLYYYFDGNKFIFGSEIKCILCHDVKRRVDKEALNLYISLRYVPFDYTLFKGIMKLPSACCLTFDLKSKTINIKKYWDFDFNTIVDEPVINLARQLRNLIEEAVKIRLVSEVPLGAFLSGGLDSSSIVGVMSKFMDKPVKTFSIGFENGAPINETKYSRYVAEYYNTDHTEILVDSSSFKILPDLIWHIDDLIADAAIIPVYLMAKYAKKKMTVALTGDGADEVFAGYSGYDNSVYYKIIEPLFVRYVPKQVNDFILKFHNYIPSLKLQTLLTYINSARSDIGRFFQGILQVSDMDREKIFPFKVKSIETIILPKLEKNLPLINQFCNWDLKYQLPGQYNMKIDKMTMATSLEARVPFLDQKIVSWSSKISPYLKYNGKIEKFILRLAMKDILPSEILKRRKQGFGTPVNLWLRTGLKDVSGDILERLEKRNHLFKPSIIKMIKRKRYDKFYENKAWNLMMFELWYETFIENDGLKPIKL